MPKKRPDPFAAVRDVIRRLAVLTHDELRDLDDMLRADAAAEADSRYLPQRHGLPPVFPGNGHQLILHGGWQYRDKPPLFTAPARQELHDAYEAAGTLPPEARAVVADVARLMRNISAPVGERRMTPDGTPLAEGTIEAKIITRKIYSETGELLGARDFGPYLYYRYLASGGGGDKRTKRLKNKYIGKQALAQRFAATEAHSDERRDMERRIIAAFKADELDALMLDMGLQPDERVPVGAVLGDSDDTPNSQPENTERPGAAPPPFLPDYVPVPTRKQVPMHFELTDDRREVLATYAAGQYYSADYRKGIHMRKIARGLADAGLLAEMSGDVKHQNHWWKLTEAGLKLVRGDADLQRRITHKMQD